jgi:hypothetical protein
MSDHQIQLALMVVNSMTLIALVLYTVETTRLRIAARDQVEAMSKPCLTIFAKLRDPADALLEMHGAVGGTVVCDNDGNFVVQNIGTGVALNVRYHFENLDSPGGRAIDENYFVNVLQGQKVRMPEPVNASMFSGNCRAVFRFESMGGGRYQSTVTMNNHVRTAFGLKSLKGRSELARAREPAVRQ